MHEELLSMQKQQQMQAQTQQLQAGGQQQPNTPPEPQQPNPGVANQNPLQAAASLRQETQKSIGQKQVQNIS